MRIKQTCIILLSCFMIAAMVPMNVFAADSKYASKDEVIYGKLDSNGNVKSMYVVNSFAVNQAGKFIDYGNYSSIRNLTDLSTIEQSENKIEFEAEADFYYQGELDNKPLPWDVSITYMLDGKEMDPVDLVGENGDLEIRIETTANERVDQTFFEYYMLQIAVTLDPAKFKNIQAPEGTEANEGKNKMLNFTVLPEQEEVFIISAQVVDLEMEPIDISAVPASIGFDSPDTEDLADEMQELADAIKEINNGVSDLSQGVSDLRGGAATLSEGSNEFQSGLTELNNSSSDLINGSQEILDVFKGIGGAMGDAPEVPDLEEIEAIPQGLRSTAEGLRELNKGINSLKEAIQNIPDKEVNPEEIKKLKDFLVDNEADERLSEIVDTLKATQDAALAAKEVGEPILKNITDTNENMASSLELIATGIDAAMEDLSLLDDISELQDGLTTMASEYETFHKGLVTYTNGISQLATNYNELNNGTSELADGVSDLEDGVKTLNDGTKELQESTSDLPNEFQSEIESFMDDFDFSDYKPVSFVSDKNEDIGVVQFVLQTESIKKEEVEEEPEEEEESKNLWERFLNLFR